MAFHKTMYILVVILVPIIYSTAETTEMVLKESGEHCQKSNECSSGRCVPDFTHVMPINLDFEGIIHHQIIRKCAVCTMNSQCQKNQYCSKFKCHNHSKPTTTEPTTTAEPTTTPESTPKEPTLQQLLTKLTQHQQKHHEHLIEKHEKLHHLLTLPICPDINTANSAGQFINDGAQIGIQVAAGADNEFTNLSSQIGTQIGLGGGDEVNKVETNPLEKPEDEKSEKKSSTLKPGVDCQPRPNNGGAGFSNVGNQVGGQFNNINNNVDTQIGTVNIFQG